MKQSKKIAISAVVIALGVAVMALGALIETVDLTVAAISSLLIVFLYLEVGSPYTWLAWIGTALAAFLVFPGSLLWIEYLLVFGVYPLLKAMIEKLPRAAWWPIKLVYLNATLALTALIATALLRLPFFERDELWYKIALFVLCSVAFVAYDLFITFMVKIYYAKFRDKIKKFLK